MDKLQIVDFKDTSKFQLNPLEMDHLIGAIEDFKKNNYKYPSKIILNTEFAQKYLNQYVQGVAFRTLYKNKTIWFTVNIRMKSSQLFMR